MKALLISILSILGFSAFAQSNLERFTPSTLLPKGQVEVNIFNNLYTQKAVRDINGNKVNLASRVSFLNNTVSVLYGVSQNSKINIGLETTISSGIYDTGTSTSLASIGPRIKLTPFNNKGLSLQSTFLFPGSSNLENPVFINHDRYSWISQLFYDKALSSQWRVFTELALWYRFNADGSDRGDFFRTPLSVILSYFPTPDLILFANTQYAPRFETLKDGEQEVFGQTQWYNQIGLGMKYQATDKVGLELSYANFWKSRNDGAGSVFNFGIRIIQ